MRCVIDWGFEMTEHSLPSGDGPYADHPVLAPLSRVVRQSIADQIAHNRNIGAIKTLRDALGGSNIGLKEAKDVIDGLVELGDPTRPGSSSAPVKVVSGKIDKAGTTLTLYRDGTFTTTGMIFTSNPDRLIGFSADTDSMRRKSVTGRGAAFIATGLGGWQHAVLPRWFAVVSVILGVLAALGNAGIPPGGLVTYLLLPFWLLTASVVIAKRQRVRLKVGG